MGSTASRRTSTSSPSSSNTTVRKKGARKRRKTFPSYQAALKCLHDRVNVERTRVMRLRRDLFKLQRMRALMDGLGNPQDAIKTVHIAGTKGKGSVCAMTSSALEACGFAVGSYTSPHLMDIRERIQINGRLISTSDFTKTLARVETVAEQIESKHGKPTFFEMLTAMSLCYFADQAVDIAIMETGLGGRLDATNVIRPEVTAVTAISHDHTQLLGADLESIAREKAGIFKKDVPALTIAQEPGVIDVMAAAAEEAGTTLEIVGREIEFSYRFEATPNLGPHTCVCLSTGATTFEHVNVPLAGEHQALNCGLALAIVGVLRARGFDAPEPRVIEGLLDTRLPGRMEIAWNEPRILLDGAHNAASLKALMRSVGVHAPYDSLVVVFGCGEDKNVDELLRCVSSGADKLIFTRTKGNPRAVDPMDLAHRFGEVSGKMTQVAANLPDALNLAARAVSRGDLICVTGSFYLVGEAKKYLSGLAQRGESP